MLRRTIASLALIKANSDVRRQDFIENFVPFIATLIRLRNYATITVDTVRRDFEAEFGLAIPLHPMQSILSRAKRHGIIQSASGVYLPVMDVVEHWDMAPRAIVQERRIGKLVTALREYASAHHATDMPEESAEAALIAYLRHHDIDILFASQARSLLPDVKASRKQRFLVNSFVRHAEFSEPELYAALVDTAFGHVLASAIVYDMDSYKGKLASVHLYFDISLVLRLVGAEGPARQEAYSEFAKLTRNGGATLHVFDHTYDEAMGILRGCQHWIQNTGYDPSKARPALRYLVESGAKKSDVEHLIVKVPQILTGYGVTIVPAAIEPRLQHYQIDESTLNGVIVEEYRRLWYDFDEGAKKFMIARDINSISAVYRLREGKQVHSLGTAGHIFLTDNGTLAYANRRFEREHQGRNDGIPGCLTDTFLGTVLWLESPIAAAALITRRMIANCHAALQPDELLLRRFVSQAQKLLGQGKITTDEFYMLRGTSASSQLLAELTKGDPDAVTDKTPLEVLGEMRRRVEVEARAQFEPLIADETRKAKENEESRLAAEQALRQANEAAARQFAKRARIAEGAGRVAGWLALLISVVPAAAAFVYGAVDVWQNLTATPRAPTRLLPLILGAGMLWYLLVTFFFDVILRDGPVRRIKSWTVTRVTSFVERILHNMAGHDVRTK